MATTIATAEPKPRTPDDQLIRVLEELIRRVEVIECTAITVRVALAGQRVDYDSEIAICVQRNVADELDRVSEALADLVVGLGGQRRTPLRDR